MDLWLIRNIGKVSKWTGLTAAWLVIPLVVVMLYEVIARKFFTPTIWSFDCAYICYGAHFMLGAAYCLYKGKHVRTDILYDKWSPRTQGLVDSIMYLFLFLPGMCFFCWLSFEYFHESLVVWERSTFSPWRPIIWPFKLVIPVSVALLILQGIAEFLKSVRRVRGKEVPSVAPVAPEVEYDES